MSRGDQQRSRDSPRQPHARALDQLREHLGLRLTAYLAGLDDTVALSSGDATATLGRDVQRRLEQASIVVTLLVDAYDERTAQAWLFGTNSRLDDRTPVDVVRSATDEKSLADVRRAATAFVGATSAYRAPGPNSPGATTSSDDERGTE